MWKRDEAVKPTCSGRLRPDAGAAGQCAAGRRGGAGTTGHASLSADRRRPL